MAERFTSPLTVRCPARLTQLVERVAERRFSTVSEYVRGAVVERLKADGGMDAYDGAAFDSEAFGAD